MAVALAKPEPEKGKRNDLLNNSTGLDFDKASLSRARFVLRNCREKAEEVLRNAKYPLTVAYEEAQAIVEKQKRDEEERQEQLRKLAILREEFSDLAALVDDQRLGLPEAIAAGDQRREAARLKAEQEERERQEKIRREREAEEARMAEEERRQFISAHKPALVALLQDAETVHAALVKAGAAGLAWREGTPADWPPARLLAADEVLYGNGRMVTRWDRRYRREHAPEPSDAPGENTP